MVASGTTRRALDLSNEEARTRDRYRGIESFLTARRLVESGVGCVTLATAAGTRMIATSSSSGSSCPTLIVHRQTWCKNLHDRGMERDTVVIVWGEFGRTPRIKRQHGRPRSLGPGHVVHDRRRRTEDGPGHRFLERPRRGAA